MHKSVNHPIKLAAISKHQHSYGPIPKINPFSYSLFLKSVTPLSHETSIYLEDDVTPQPKNQSGQISMRVTIQFMEEKQSKYGSGRGSFADEIRLQDGDEEMLNQMFRNSSSKLDRNQFKLKLNKLQNSQTPQNHSIHQITKKAYFLYFLSFATNIILPLNKSIRLILEQSLNKTGITVEWRKGYDYYIGYLGRTVKPMLCWADINFLFQQTIWYEEINEIECVFAFMGEISQSKKKNAYLYCEDTFRTQLLPQLVQMQEQEVFPQYQSLLNFIQTAYQSLSCRKIIEKYESDEHRRKSKNKFNQVTNMSTHRTYVNSLRTTKKIVHSLESSLSNSREEQSNYSLKKLKQEMKNLLLNGIDQNKSRISGKLTNQDNNGKVLIDSEVKQFVCENIRSLFESEYQNIKQTHGTKAEKCKALVSNMSQYLKIDYKCQYFIELIIEQFLTSKKDKTIVELEKSFIKLVEKNKKGELDEKWQMHDCKENEKIIISRIVTKQNEDSRIQLNFNDLQNDNDEMLLSQNEEIDRNLPKTDLQKKVHTIQNPPNFNKGKENQFRKSSLAQQKFTTSKSIGSTQTKPLVSTRQKVKTENSVRTQPKQNNDKYLSNKIQEIKKQSSLQQSQRDKNKENTTFGSRPRTKTETSDTNTKPQIKNHLYPKQTIGTLSKPSTPKSSLNSTLSSANLNKLSMKTNTAATPKVSANKLENSSKTATPKSRAISNSSSTKKLWQ